MPRSADALFFDLVVSEVNSDSDSDHLSLQSHRHRTPPWPVLEKVRFLFTVPYTRKDDHFDSDSSLGGVGVGVRIVVAEASRTRSRVSDAGCSSVRARARRPQLLELF